MSQEIEPKFIVDINAGKLVHWLRLMGYDAVLFNDKDDGIMIKNSTTATAHNTDTRY